MPTERRRSPTPRAPRTDQIIASFTGSDGMSHTSNVVTKTWTSTNKSPACDLTGTGVNASGNAFIDIRAQDTDNGLQSIVVTSSTNADTVVPPFSPGTTAPVVVRSTKITNGQGSNVALTVTDIAGTKTDCDPRVLQLKVGRRGVGRKTVRKLPRAESKVLIQNGHRALRRLTVRVNGKRFAIGRLAPKGARRVDVASAMRRGHHNVIQVIGRGHPGATAVLVVSD